MIEKLIYESEPLKNPPELDPDIEIVRANPDHIPDLIRIYRAVFETYPSPLTNPDFIASTMERHSIYRIAFRKGEAIAAASADIDTKHSNAEMTDCATDPTQQGRGVMKHLLFALEGDLRERGVMTAYTLARAMSIGMNKVFFRLGYEFSGRLVNNCDIFGQFEDMNIWVKRLTSKID